MRATSVLRQLLDMKHVVVVGFDFDEGALVLEVRPSWHHPRCSRCGQYYYGRHDLMAARCWRHLDFGGVRVKLRYKRRRVYCTECDVVVVEAVPWSSKVRPRFTDEFEEQVAYLVQVTDKTAVTRLMRIDWRTVGRIVERVVDRLGPKDRLDGLEIIGIDEFSFRKRHKYLTVVCDHQRHRIVWAAEGMTTATAMKFFAELGVERCQAIRAVTMDMGTAYITAVRTAVPNAQLVFDRFHVQQLVSRALDKTRRQEWQRMRPKVSREAASDLKGYRWAVLKRPWNLSARDKAKLKTLEANNRRLYRAYLLKEQFVQIMDEHDPDLMKSQLRSWLTAASRSRLPEFVRTAKTLRKYVDDIVAYARLRRINNGLVEGLNNKARMVMRRAYGFHSAKSTIAMIMLCCGGVQLRPVVKCAQN